MKKITSDVLRFVQQKVPGFVERVTQAKEGQGDQAPLTLTLSCFADDPFLLYAALWYAYGEGVEVTFQARKRPARR